MDENYAYLNARIAAMKSRLFPMSTYQKMLIMDLAEITRFISEGEYKEDIIELSKSFRGIDLIEYALNLNLARTYQKLINISKGTANVLISGYMKRWDIENIKSILRGSLSGASAQEISETLIPIGKLRFSYLVSLTKKEFSKIKTELEEKEIIPKGYSDLPALETELDKRYYEEIITLAKLSKEKEMVSFLEREIDMRNLKIVLRIKKEKENFEKINAEIIPMGKKITLSTISGFKDMEFDETVDTINKLFPELALNKDSSLSTIEQEIDKNQILYGEKISHLHMFSVLSALGFILKKYQEITNLRLIVRGKQLEVSSETIKKMLVV
ncbi:MAG: V-type ATPase subunit [Candidatus Methanofastidiosia archaeon]